MEPKEPVRVGFVGAGSVASYHARALRSLPFVEIVGVAGPDEVRARALAEEFEIPRIYPSLKAMAEARPQVVHILTPAADHAQLACEAIVMGCHVFVEPPLAETAADCDRMIELARQRGVVLSVNHSARFDPIVLKALELLRNGVCGEVTAADFLRSSEYPAYPGGPAVPPQFGAGSYPFQDLGVHGLYLLETFLGPIENADIRYYASGIGDPNLVFDEWHGLVDCARGVGRLYLSWNVRPMRNEIVVHGTRGVMHVDCELKTISLFKTYPGPNPGQRILGDGLNSLKMLWKGPANTIRFLTGRLKRSPGIRLSVVRFHEALHRGEAPPVSAAEGRRAIAAIEDVLLRADADKFEYLAESQPANPPRILVTGANGFLGRALVRRLRGTGEPLRLLLRRPSQEAFDEDLHIVYGDLGNPEVADRAVRGIDIVFHVGAATKGGPSEFQSGTIWGTRNIVDACARHRVSKLVYVSSMSVLDHAGHVPGEPVSENFPYEPHPDQRGLNAQTKLEAERNVMQACAENEITAVILRPGQIYGPGGGQAPPDGAIEIAGHWLMAGGGDHYVPLVYVENVVDALMAAAAADLPNGAIFQLVDPLGIRQKDYIEWVRRSGRRVRALYVPARLLDAAAWLIERLGKLLNRSVSLTPYRVKSMTPLWPCDCTAAHTMLGWKPRYSIEQGMAATFPPGGTASQPEFRG